MTKISEDIKDIPPDEWEKFMDVADEISKRTGQQLVGSLQYLRDQMGVSEHMFKYTYLLQDMLLHKQVSVTIAFIENFVDLTDQVRSDLMSSLAPAIKLLNLEEKKRIIRTH